MKTFLKCTVFFGVLSLAASIPAIAQDIMSRDGMVIGNQSVGVSGVVTDVGIESFTIVSSGNDIEVSTQEMDIDNLDELIRTGMRVEVEGDMGNQPDPTIEAEEIRVVGMENVLTQQQRQAISPLVNPNPQPIFIYPPGQAN